VCDGEGREDEDKRKKRKKKWRASGLGVWRNEGEKGKGLMHEGEQREGEKEEEKGEGKRVRRAWERRKRKKREEKRKERGKMIGWHVASWEWVRRDDEIPHSQSSYDTWQGWDPFHLTPPTYINYTKALFYNISINYKLLFSPSFLINTIYSMLNSYKFFLVFTLSFFSRLISIW